MHTLRQTDYFFESIFIGSIFNHSLQILSQIAQTGYYRITATGASGGYGWSSFSTAYTNPTSSWNVPGRGGIAQGIFYLTAGLSLKIAVGQAGSASTSKTNTWATDGWYAGGGGGGTFVWITDQPSVPLLAAGGGGGGGAYTGGYPGRDAQAASIGGTSVPGSGTGYGIGGSGGMVRETNKT